MRALLKSTIQGVFGRLPAGPAIYRHLTRHVMGTQSSHIDKLSHAWPDYADLWLRNGICLEGKTIWIHGGGWTVYPCLLSFLLTGKGGVVSIWEGSADDQYTVKSIDFALSVSFRDHTIPEERLALIRSLRGKTTDQILNAINGKIVRMDRVTPAMADSSADLVVTGGVLEHFRPHELRGFLYKTANVLKPGGWCSHVFDLRDHLYHADKSIPFLNHLRLSDFQYKFRYGHPLGYHNRLLPAELEALIQSAGFQIRTTRRRILPQNRWATGQEDFDLATPGLDRSLLAPRFRNSTDEDLRTTAIQFLAQKPTRNE
jgi:SAM-dependent methyltransferase